MKKNCLACIFISHEQITPWAHMIDFQSVCSFTRPCFTKIQTTVSTKRKYSLEKGPSTQNPGDPYLFWTFHHTPYGFIQRNSLLPLPPRIYFCPPPNFWVLGQFPCVYFLLVQTVEQTFIPPNVKWYQYQNLLQLKLEVISRFQISNRHLIWQRTKKNRDSMNFACRMCESEIGLYVNVKLPF